MLWQVNGRGFLPNSNPIATLPVNDIKNTQLIYAWENIIHNLPHFINERCVREELVSQLRDTGPSYYHGMIDSLGGEPEYEHAFLLFTFFTAAFLNARDEKKRCRVPKEISIPLMRLAFLVGRKPILDYYSYFLYNWYKKNPSKGIVFDNIEPIATFTDSEEEKTFIKTFVVIESLVAELVNSSEDTFLESLTNIVSNIKELEHIKLDYFKCFYNTLDNIEFEGCNLKNQHFIMPFKFPSFLRYLQGKISCETTQDADGYRPKEHTSFIHDQRFIKDSKIRTLSVSLVEELGVFVNKLFGEKIYI